MLHFKSKCPEKFMVAVILKLEIEEKAHDCIPNMPLFP
jgi:hypothetical protein